MDRDRTDHDDDIPIGKLINRLNAFRQSDVGFSGSVQRLEKSRQDKNGRTGEANQLLNRRGSHSSGYREEEDKPFGRGYQRPEGVEQEQWA